MARRAVERSAKTRNNPNEYCNRIRNRGQLESTFRPVPVYLSKKHRQLAMKIVATIWLDLPKQVFQVHGEDKSGGRVETKVEGFSLKLGLTGVHVMWRCAPRLRRSVFGGTARAQRARRRCQTHLRLSGGLADFTFAPNIVYPLSQCVIAKLHLRALLLRHVDSS